MRKIAIVTGICAVLISAVYLQCKNSKPADPRGDAYAGSAACAKCHSNVYNSYLHTAHYVASIPADEKTVHGSFAKNLNTVSFSTFEKVVMEKRDSGMYQTHYLNGKVKKSHRFDIVLGGVKGESYLYWSGNSLYQLPISYFTAQDKWLLSPRFDPRYVNFKRGIKSRCFECHAAYIGDQPAEVQSLGGNEQFDKSTLVYSVDCERCHGPGAQHADFQTNNPGVKTAKFITRFRSLPRARRMDMCGVCHSGNKAQMLRSTFAFIPGDTLANYQLPEFTGNTNASTLDVHGNQLQLLESSKCFISSKMDCATCHDTHQNQRGNTVVFTQKCLSCHSTANHNDCKMANARNMDIIRANCIKCHMPALGSQAILTSNVAQTFTADILVHTHHIAIYPQQTKQVLAMLKK